MFDVLHFELLFGTVEKNSQILPIDAELPADFVTISFIEKNGFEQRAIALWQAQQNFADFLLNLAGSHNIESVCTGGGQLGRAFFVK